MGLFEVLETVVDALDFDYLQRWALDLGVDGLLEEVRRDPES